MREMLGAKGGKLSEDMLAEITENVGRRGDELLREAQDGVRLMMKMLEENDSDDLARSMLEVFRMSNDIHNWKDFDAWMRQKITGGEFSGQVKTGALISELQGVMVNSILSGPKTPLRAILGTSTNTFFNALNESAGAMITAGFGGDVISRQTSFAKLKGLWELGPEAWQLFKHNIRSKFNADIADIRTRYSEPPTRGDVTWEAYSQWTERNGTVGDKAALYITNQARALNNNKLLSWSPRILAATDDTFKWLMARTRSKEKAMRELLESGVDVKKLDPAQLKAVEDKHFNDLLDIDGNIDVGKDSWLRKQYQEVTLTSELNGFSKKLDRLISDYPLLKPFYLFARTGVNGLNLSFKNTPLLSLLHKESMDILSHRGDDFTPLMKYGIENANDWTNAKNLIAGRQAVGSIVVGTAALMYQAGHLTGNGPADRQLKQSFINSGTWKPNHLYLGNVGFDYRSLEPFNVIFSSIADIGDNMELMGTEWAEKRLQAVAFVIGRGLTGKSYLSGLDQLMQVMQNPFGPESAKASMNILNNSVPLAGMRNEFGKWINPHMKELNSSMWDSVRNRNQASELISTKPLPNKHDMLDGTPINNWNIIGRSFNAISPIQIDIRKDSPGRRLLRDSNYDLKTTVYSYGGYSFVKHNHVRSHFQNAIGSVPIRLDGKNFKNLSGALDYLATREDIQISMAQMKANMNDPARNDINPNTGYPHNTVIDKLFNQARAKAWALINDPKHPAYQDVQKAKAEKDGHSSRTRDNRKEILELGFPQKQRDFFPKN